MNIFNDADTAAQLNELKNQIFGVTGETLKEQPALAEKLSEVCAVLKQELLDPNSVSSLTGRLKRRVVLTDHRYWWHGRGHAPRLRLAIHCPLNNWRKRNVTLRRMHSRI